MALSLSSASAQYGSRPPDERFRSMADFQAALTTRRTRSRTFTGDQRGLRLDVGDGDRLVMRAGSAASVPLSHASLAHVASLAGAPAGYLSTLPPAIVASALNHGLQNQAPAYNNGKVKLLGLLDEVGQLDTLRGVTSTSYGRIWDADMLGSLLQLVDRTGGTLHPAPGWDGTLSLYTGDRDTFVMLIDGGSVIEEPGGFGHRPGQLHRGIMARNSETGHAAFEFLLFWFRVICGNYMIHDGQVAGSISLRHTRLAPERLGSAATAGTLRRILDQSTADDQAMIAKAGQILLPNDDKGQVVWLRDKGFGAAEAGRVIEMARREEGDSRTVWQVVQGATAMARDMQHASAGADLSRRATKLLRLAA